jgi:hypothetical protein
MTMVRDEAVFLPIWLRYYSRFFPPEDIYVLDHGSTDGSTDGAGFVRVPVEHETVDHAWRLEAVKEQQQRLLEEYDVVLAVDVDEIVAPDPEWGTLREYLSGFQEDYVNCLGYEILHLRDREPPLDPGLPIMEQRGYWFAAKGYDKPALATEPLSWKPGFHSRADERWNLDPDLMLIHLHRVDHDICRARHRAWSDWAWSDQDLSRGWAAHNRITEDAEFERWFYTGSSSEEDTEIVIERIPARWRRAF